MKKRDLLGQLQVPLLCLYLMDVIGKASKGVWSADHEWNDSVELNLPKASSCVDGINIPT